MFIFLVISFPKCCKFYLFVKVLCFSCLGGWVGWGSWRAFCRLFLAFWKFLGNFDLIFPKNFQILSFLSFSQVAWKKFGNLRRIFPSFFQTSQQWTSTLSRTHAHQSNKKCTTFTVVHSNLSCFLVGSPHIS